MFVIWLIMNIFPFTTAQKKKKLLAYFAVHSALLVFVCLDCEYLLEIVMTMSSVKIYKNRLVRLVLPNRDLSFTADTCYDQMLVNVL